MSHLGIPKKQGLYDPINEHDACGIGFVANIKANPSHEIVIQAIEMLCQLEHRGGQGSDPKTGDGAGIMVQIPHSFFEKKCKEEGITLPEPQKYGVGMFFMPADEVKRKQIEKEVENIIVEEGQILLGWRDVPVDPSEIGSGAIKTQPYIRQIFIQANELLVDEKAFERKLYIIRKRAERIVTEENLPSHENFYIASLSTRTIVYKGMLTSWQINLFYLDLKEEAFESAYALVHSRFSTNTFPSWERAHPNRYLVHNGEINTLRGNVNWMNAREKVCQTDIFGEELEKTLPIIDGNGSDSAQLDNALEFLTLSGRSLPHAAMMLIPEPWDHDASMQDPKRAFYEYHSAMMEPWDGPTSISFTDGRKIGTILDRNGLRPARYYITNDDMIIYSSEVGVVSGIPEEKIVAKERLSPGKMLLVDLEAGRIISDDELKGSIASAEPYREWLDQNLVHLSDLENKDLLSDEYDSTELLALQNAYGYTYEELNKNLKPMVTEGKDPIGAMGTDTPLAVLSERPQLLYNYFKQLFAQVTNPPIDSIREELVTSTLSYLGAEGNLLSNDPINCNRIRLETPILNNMELEKIRETNKDAFHSKTLSILFNVEEGEAGLEKALDTLFSDADAAIEDGYSLLILSDVGLNHKSVAIPTLLAVSGLHHHLVKKGTRTKVSLIAETGEARDVHQFAMLLGYGVDAINPYLGIASIISMLNDGSIEGFTKEEAINKYISSATSGVVKVMSKMGISTIQSYRGAQIFEAIGIHSSVVDRYFTNTSSQIGGIKLETIAKEALLRHEKAFHNRENKDIALETGSEMQWRRNGEFHAFNPKTIHTLQHATRTNDYKLFKEYSKMADEEQLAFLRSVFEFDKTNRQSVPIDEVESVEAIVKRFKTGAMSFGSLSKEAHEALAIAMNRIGGKSNSGEGGEDPSRFIPDENGDLRRSAIKQVASGRFGVNSHYLVNADEIQIKMAQGAKPGEGGHLPGKKVYPWVAEVRGTTAGVGLISPPPHHDIYSIEDLSQLIHDLKNSNPSARISVKLVSKTGVGTIAAGVAKGLADVILISGYEGGTGASPVTSIKHAGLPWELGLAETHQTLLLNGLRDRVVVETDGKMMTGRDVVVASLLGAEEFGFATAPLVILGCVMMRVCHMDTCPVGVATQNPELRAKFTGSADHVVNYMKFIAQEVREIMAELGFRTINEMVGQSQVLKVSNRSTAHWKAKDLDLSALLYQPKLEEGAVQYNIRKQNHKLEQSLDMREILPTVQDALENQMPVEVNLNIRNIDRVVGTILGSEVTKRYGANGLPEDTIKLNFYGSAGQSFGAFVPKGITMRVTGDANDYIAKGLSGGKVIVHPPAKTNYVSHESVIAGNVSLFGATSGEVYINGKAGERFGVRNSGAKAVVEGVGDHACEYMTGGRVVVLGETGKNFASGMSGGIAYIYAEDKAQFEKYCNRDMVLLEEVVDSSDVNELKELIENHRDYTGSIKADLILENWNVSLSKFIKVIPRDYKQMLHAIEDLKNSGLNEEDAVLTAFEMSKTKGLANNATKKVLEPVQN